MISKLKELVTFIRVEALSGVVLLAAALLAILMKNSPLSSVYEGIVGYSSSLGIGGFELPFTTLQIVNDLMMTVFFLVVGLEIKREFLVGELSNMRAAMLPIYGALGGMLVPAVIYSLFNLRDPSALNGWAIPAATDIAFSLGVLSLFGRRLPFSLKVFLTALAIIDDLLAILVIAFFYTEALSSINLILGLLTLSVLIGLNRAGIKQLRYYLFPGLVLFYFIHHSGVHATIAGVLLAFTIPYKGNNDSSPLVRLEHFLHPWGSYFVLPIFAFVNSGISINANMIEGLSHSITIGCITGLFIGKQIGVFWSARLAVKFGAAALPDESTWAQIYGISLLTGIGFTMSLFIGGLAFSDQSAQELVKAGVILGSLLSAVAGSLMLMIASK